MKETGIIMSGDHPRKILDGTKTMTRRTWGLEWINLAPAAWEFLRMEGDKGIFKLTGSDLPSIYAQLANVLRGSYPLIKGESPNLLVYIKCPYGGVGDLLWIKETHMFEVVDSTTPNAHYDEESEYHLLPRYKADGIDISDYFDIDSGEDGGKWKPSIFMPRWASRIDRVITGLRAERLQEITEEDAKGRGTIRTPVKIKAGWIYRALEDYEYEAYPLRYWFKKGTLLRADFPSLGHARFYAMDDRIGDKLVIMNPKEAFSILEDPNMSYVEAFSNLWDSLNGKRGYGWETNPWVWPISF